MSVSCSTSDDHSKSDRTADFADFLRLFEKQMTYIPNSVAKQFLEFDTTQISRVWAYEKVNFQNDLIGLIYKADCTAGGTCERFVLLIFDKSGTKLSETEVGHHFADYGSDKNLTYSIVNNRIELKLRETERIAVDDGTDKEQVRLDTTYYKQIDMRTGRVD